MKDAMVNYFSVTLTLAMFVISYSISKYGTLFPGILFSIVLVTLAVLFQMYLHRLDKKRKESEENANSSEQM